MPEIMPFGKYSGSSIEQIALRDYKYFTWMHDTLDIKKYSLRSRVQLVEHKSNHFLSAKSCQCCVNPAEHISIIPRYDGGKASSGSYVFCSRECFKNASAIHERASLYPLGFRSAISQTKQDTNMLVKIMADCMGIRPARRSKEYLENFYNQLQIR